MTSNWEPPGLREVVESVAYKPEWEFNLVYTSHESGKDVLVLYITSYTTNSFDFKKMTRVRHEFMVPLATYNHDNWVAWVFERIQDVEANHEAGEFFRVNGVRVFAPHHGNGENPYRVWYVSDWETASKSSGED